VGTEPPLETETASFPHEKLFQIISAMQINPVREPMSRPAVQLRKPWQRVDGRFSGSAFTSERAALYEHTCAAHHLPAVASTSNGNSIYSAKLAHQLP